MRWIIGAHLAKLWPVIGRSPNLRHTEVGPIGLGHTVRRLKQGARTDPRSFAMVVTGISVILIGALRLRWQAVGLGLVCAAIGLTFLLFF